MNSSRYHIVVQGQLGERFAEAFDDMTQAPQGRRTVLQGSFIHRSELDGILDRLRLLGLEISSFNVDVTDTQGTESQHDH